MQYLHLFYSRWLQLWHKEKSDYELPAWRFFLRTGILIVLYMVVEKVLLQLTQMPAATYREPIIYLGFLRRLGTTWYAIPLLLILIISFFLRRQLITSWSAFPHGKSVRILIVLVTGLLAWAFSTYDYNLFAGEEHYADRLLLIFLAFLAYRRPVFVLPFLTVLLPVLWQFFALPGFSWTAPLLLVRVLFLFVTFFTIYLLTKNFSTFDFFFLTGCLIAAHYWVSGWGKLSWEWIRYNQISYLLPATYANGWLQFWPDAVISSITQKLTIFNIPLKLFTILVECGAIFFFWRPRVTPFIMAGWILLHVGIFFVTGICFWMWMILEAGFLFLFLDKKFSFSQLPVYSNAHFIASVVLIAGGTLWCNPMKLSWYDVPATYTYRLEAETESGKTYSLPPVFFAPFDYQFTLSRFPYLTDRPLLNITWGTTKDAGAALALWKMTSPEEVFDLEKKQGIVHYNPELTVTFDVFIKQYMNHWNQRLSKKTWLSLLKAPRLLWTFPACALIDEPEPVRRVKVFQVTSLFLDDHYLEIRKVPVRTIQIY